jgi:hypothetical protein
LDIVFASLALQSDCAECAGEDRAALLDGSIADTFGGGEKLGRLPPIAGVSLYLTDK